MQTGDETAGATAEIDRVVAALRSRLEDGARAVADGGARLETLLAEVRPFVESAQRAVGEPAGAAAWAEARSFAWLLAYRLGDQDWPAHLAAAVVPAWRDALGAGTWALRAADEIVGLFLDGYARGREDRARAEAQRGLCDALPVTELAPHVVLITAAGPLDPDGARALADRASAYLLRRDARAALMDIEGLRAPTAAVLVELWSVASSARTLGVRMVVSGIQGVVAEAIAHASLHDEGEARVATLAQGVEWLAREGQIAVATKRGVTHWMRGMLATRRSTR